MQGIKAIQKDFSPDEVDLCKNVTDWALPAVRKQNIQWSMGMMTAF